MTHDALAAFVNERYARLLARCREASVILHDDAGVAERIQRVILASDFAFEAMLREPDLLAAQALTLMADPRPADARPPQLDLRADEAEAMAVLRRHRRRESLRLVWRDVNALDGIESTLAGASALAESCIAAALAYCERVLALRHGTPRDVAGAAQRLVVIAMGKLGGYELNFSSDIDLILAYPGNGASDGARPLPNEAYFARLAQMLVKLLAQISVDGFVFRVDLRLRPFGNAGPIASSFAAMEQYYQREGRDWERYALVKARAVAGDVNAGKQLLQDLRPFVYRRYLDYTAFAGLREMKALIDAEVARRDLADNLKLGPGGIREIEFVVQLLQMIRGGREASLRERGLLPALAACERVGALPGVDARRLRDAYCLLRRAENRVQMLRDEQVHDLPADAFDRERMARAMGEADWVALQQRLRGARADVAAIFAEHLAPAPSLAPADATLAAARFWRDACSGSAEASPLAELGYPDAQATHASVVALAQAADSRRISARARARLDRLMPQLLVDAAASKQPDACLERLLRLLHAVLRRSAYLALLEERGAARLRLVEICAGSALLAERVIAHPLLLDELLVGPLREMPTRADIEAQLQRRLGASDAQDDEAQVEVLQEEKSGAVFRIGLAYRAGASAVACAAGLAAVAEATVARALAMAERDIVRQHGALGDGLAVIGYGSLGGSELGFASDLDLVFVYDERLAARESDGARPLEGARYFARVAQRTVHWLGTRTHAGSLYEVDVRLRPDGAKGMLVVGLEAFSGYQRERAWIWETQALVRARPIAGAARMQSGFARLRDAVLCAPRDADSVRMQVAQMRTRWRAERDRSDQALLDLKQGSGALLDIEFILQTQLLLHAHRCAAAPQDGSTANLIRWLAGAALLDATQSRMLAAAHACFLSRGLDCTLDARPRVVPRDATLEAHAAAVRRAAEAVGLQFG